MENRVRVEIDPYDVTNTNRNTIESNCNEITFVNRADGQVLINGFPLASGETLRIAAADLIEYNTTKFMFQNDTATIGFIYVFRKLLVK